jgi:hypothetical protein
MDNGVRLIIYKKKLVYDDIFVTSDFACTFHKCPENNDFQYRKFKPIVLRKKGFNAYLVAIYVDVIYRSEDFRQSIVDFFKHFIKLNTNMDESNSIILIKLQTPKYQYLDYTWLALINNIIIFLSK